MDMSKLLNKVEQRVAEATCNVVKTKTSSSLPPTDNASCSPSTVELPTPSGFLEPSYAPPTFHFKLNPTLTKTSSFSAAAFADAIAQPLPETEPTPTTWKELEARLENPSSPTSEADIMAINRFLWRSYTPLASRMPNPAPTIKEPEEMSKWNCNQIRTKIRNFLGTKELTQTEFLGLLDIEPEEFHTFMSLTGPNPGKDSLMYQGGCIFFDRWEKRKKEKLKAMKPKDRKRKADEQKQVKAKRSKDGADLLKRIEEVELPDMDDDGIVPVFDDCDEIREKISFFLGEGLVTKAAFLRALGDVNSNSLRGFMSLKRGANSGVRNVVYRTAYAFFEKKRILEGKEKSIKRLANEDLQGPDGFPVDHEPNGYFFEKFLGY